MQDEKISFETSIFSRLNWIIKGLSPYCYKSFIVKRLCPWQIKVGLYIYG